MKKDTKVWLEIAKEDYKYMEHMWRDRLYRGAVLFAQQAVEKIVKAYITETTPDSPRKIHRVENLIKDARLDLNEVDYPDIEDLSIAYEWARYRDMGKSHFKTKKDVEPLIIMAQKVYTWVLKKLEDN